MMKPILVLILTTLTLTLTLTPTPTHANSFIVDIVESGVPVQDIFRYEREFGFQFGFEDPSSFSYTQFSAMPATESVGEPGVSRFQLVQFTGNPCLTMPPGAFANRAVLVSATMIDVSGMEASALNVSLPLPCPVDVMFRNFERAGAAAILASPSVVTSRLDGSGSIFEDECDPFDPACDPYGSGAGGFDPITGAPIAKAAPLALEKLIALPASSEFANFNSIAIVLRDSEQLEYLLDPLSPVDQVTVTFYQRALIATELAALRAIYTSLNGPNWNWDSNAVNGVPWLFRDGADPCRDNWARVVCSVDGYVDQLLLSQMNLIGNLPAALGGLGRISLIDLSENRIFGTLPTTVGQWNRLRYFSLAENSISGTGLPSSWRTLKSIEVLDLSGNLFSGSLIEYPFPPNATVIRMDRNNLTGPLIPNMSRFVALSEFRVGSNQLTGSIPPTFFTTLNAVLSILDLSANQFTGPVPPVLYSACKFADLSANSLTLLPSPFPGSFPPIQYLFMGGNELTALPDFDQFGELISLDVSFNKLSGVLRPIKASSLKTLSVSGNELRTLSPSFAAFYENAESVDIFDEYYDPTLDLIDEELRYNGTGLAVFEAAGNKFSSLRDLLLRLPSSLAVIDLSFNELVYPLPQLKLGDFGIFSNLQKLDLSNNNISALFQVSQTDPLSLALLSELDLSNNQLFGPISELFGSLPSLRVLDLTNNKMTRLSGPGPLVPQFMIANYDSVDISALAGAACPTFGDITNTLQIKIDHSYHNFLLCTCRDGFYNSTEGSCLACLSNANCVGYPTTKLTSAMTPRPGYFPLSKTVEQASPFAIPSQAAVNASLEAEQATAAAPTRALTQASTVTADGSTVVSSVPAVMKGCEFGSVKPDDDDNPCEITDSGEFSCRVGHEGRLCASCTADYFNREGVCVPCKDTSGLWPAIFVIFTLIVVLASGAIATVRDTIPHIERLYTPMFGVRACLAKRAQARSTERKNDDQDSSDMYTYASVDSSGEDEQQEEEEGKGGYRSKKKKVVSSSSLSDSELSELLDVVDEGTSSGKMRRRALRLYVQSVIQVVINFFQTLTICIADLSIPSAALPVFAVSEVTKTSSEGIGLECFSAFKSFYSRYVVMMLLPVIIMLAILALFSVKFFIRYPGKAAKQHKERRPEVSGSGSSYVDEEQEVVSYGSSYEEYETAARSLSLIVGSSSAGDTGDVSVERPEMLRTPRSKWVIYGGQVVYVVFLALNYFFFPITSFVLDVFNCEEDPVSGVSYMVSQPSLACDYLSLWEKLVPLSTYVFLPILVLFGVMVWLEMYGTNFLINTSFGFWLDPYRSSRRYFSILFLMRRFLLAVIVTFLDVESLERHVFIFGVLVVSVVLDYEVKPFFYRKTTTVDVLAHVMLIFVYATSLLADLLNVTDESASFAATVLIVCMILGGLVLIWAVVIPMYTVLVKGKWHDQGARDKYLERVRAAHDAWLEGERHPYELKHA